VAARNHLLAVSLLTLGLLAASATRVRAVSPQETADGEGDQSDMTPADVESPFANGRFEPVAQDGPVRAHPYDEVVRHLLGDGVWGAEIVLIGENGRRDTLAELNENESLMPASKMKMFTGWFGWVATEKLRLLGKSPKFPAPWLSYEAFAAYTLKNSDNDKAKAILKKFAPVNGPAVMEAFYADLGLATKENFKVADAAGLSTANRVTAHLEVALLDSIRGTDQYEGYRELLARPGATGTLRARLHGLKGELFAKTGTLTATRVAALAGYLDLGGEGTIVFSIIGNDPSLPIEVQRERIDQLVERLDHDGAKPISLADENMAIMRRLDRLDLAGRFQRIDSALR
jgi:D-alanyl-D-alanine carboxypeptidase